MTSLQQPRVEIEVNSDLLSYVLREPALHGKAVVCHLHAARCEA